MSTLPVAEIESQVGPHLSGDALHARVALLQVGPALLREQCEQCEQCEQGCGR